MTFEQKQRIEREIVMQLVRDALKAGYSISVNESEVDTLIRSTDKDQIENHLFNTYEERLLIYKDGKRIGWVQLIYGNGGWDVMADNSITLEDTGILTEARKLASKYADGA